MLEGFEKVCPSKGIPTLAVVNQGLIFNRHVAKYFGERTPVVFLINTAKKKVAIQRADKHDKGSMAFFRKMEAQRFVYRNLVQSVMDMVDFDTEHYYYKIKGEFVDDDKAVIFDLNEAEQKDRIYRNKKDDNDFGEQ